MTYIQETAKLTPVYTDVIETLNRTFAQVRLGFFGWWNNRNIATWDDYLKYCLWEFAATNTGSMTWTTPKKFATQEEMFSYMEANLPSSSDRYSYPTSIRLQEEVNTYDSFPNKLVHRNSLVASMAGKHRWHDKHAQYYGVDANFNTAYYTNFNNELGQKFVEAATSVLPATNNDDCVWYPRASRSAWNWPNPGATLNLSSPGRRGAVWDSTASDWVVPSPAGTYTVQNPFLLHEYKRNKTLAIQTSTGVSRRSYELNSVAALVFPCISASRYYGFLVKPHGGDCWVTEAQDTSNYDVLLKLRYRRAYASQYVAIQPWPTVMANSEDSMWSHFSPTGAGSLLFKKQLAQLVGNVNNNIIPTKVYICRRNKQTGQRSEWVPIYNIRRRIKNAAFRIEPAQ